MAVLVGLFLQVLGLCQRAELVTLGRVGLGNTEVRANAWRHKAMSYGRMQERERQLKFQSTKEMCVSSG